MNTQTQTQTLFHAVRDYCIVVTYPEQYSSRFYMTSLKKFAKMFPNVNVETIPIITSGCTRFDARMVEEYVENIITLEKLLELLRPNKEVYCSTMAHA